MSNLFNLDEWGSERGATFSSCRKYRYKLWRVVGNVTLPSLIVIGLNPSTADETVDDPTIRKCMGYARKWGFGRLVMLNLFAFRATDPNDMKAAAEPVGPENDATLSVETRGRTTLCAWGAHGDHRGRARIVRALLKGRDLVCFGRTKSGEPKHPLYLPGNATLEPLAPAPTPASRGGSAEGTEDKP